MVLKNRNIQTANILFSSWALTLLVIGLIMEEWAELLPRTKKNKISHSPWKTCCTAFWPDGLKAIKMTLVVVLSLAFHLNLIMGLQLTSMLPQNKCVHITIAFLGFITGFLLLYALVKYYLKLKQGQAVYFSSFRTTWVFMATCFAVIIFLTCGVLSLLQCKQSLQSCSCLRLRASGARLPLARSSIEVISERAAVPRSIVRVHSTNTTSKEEELLGRASAPERHVSWAV
ncbi:transmembrane protein 225 [Perognathus longimembris pacificus]|uniref:transmembrane protein 225 n=1 Tax=Perognathus longimembris pacificus TaxID=214514 RepID=UPI002019737C|nr:transmembrane protein 225 [Perognathus longimembris pacificus]